MTGLPDLSCLLRRDKVRGMEEFAEMQWQHPLESYVERNATGGVVHFVGSDGVALDDVLLAVWEAAAGKTAVQLRTHFPQTPTRTLITQLQALQAAGLLLPTLRQAQGTQFNIHHPQSTIHNPLVSVIIVSRNGRSHLAECLPSLVNQTYTNLEIILVDDQSTDDTLPFVVENYPQIKVVTQHDGPNFPAGNNLGIAHATGNLLFLLNNDTVLDPNCVAELVAAWDGRETVGGVAAMLHLYGNRPFVNGLGSQLRRFGFGHDSAIGSLDVGQFAGITAVPLLSFGATLIPRRVWEIVGPLDERYQFYYEDADWSYRARLHGFDLIPAPKAKVYHKFSASTSLLANSFKTRLATRNRLWFSVKNFPLHSLPLHLIAYFVNDMGHAGANLWRGKRPLAGAILQAWREAIQGLPHALQQRRQIKPRFRSVPLAQLAALFPPPEMIGPHPRLTDEIVMTRYQPYLAAAQPNGRSRLLIISPDTVAANMGGVGIRYWELAHQLASVADVVLASPQPTSLVSETVTLANYAGGTSDLKMLAETADLILLSGFTIHHHPFLREAPQHLIIDLYDPMLLENLERFANRPADEREGLHQLGITTFNRLFAAGDFFICASEKQRDYWLGALSVVNRVNPATYDADPTLRRLIDLVPTGLPAEPPQATQAVLKGAWPGIGVDDKVILWGGGLWDWLDPLTVIAAMPQVLESAPEARLFFLGTKHPNPEVPPSRMAQQAIGLAEELSLKDTAVFFNDWTPYQERVNYLLEADVGVSLHEEHIETHFAVRTRLMDYLWAKLPMVVTGGDVLSDLVQAHGLGLLVGEKEKTAVAEALITLLQNPVPGDRFQPVIDKYTWETVSQPLKKYAQAPWRNGAKGEVAATGATYHTAWHQLPQKALTAVRQRGLKGLINDTRSYIRWIAQS
ncbi:MAG: glycosyltransferase [Chloroflexota bacterium]